ncbi:competence protein CoiA family protein [Thauera aminoaromatica]|uniref:competence protein CoiA family protein n=1 Tax=Thauera aminoaromatica TaxID=164330 RepID=UPI0035B273B5
MSERTLHGLDFGLDHTGRMRGIDEVEQGLACDCECPECGSPLVARKGAVRVHHFAHRGASCATGAESALHRMAKQIVADERRLVEPGRDTPTVFRDAALPDEMHWPGRRPDVVLWSESMTLHVEVTVTHRCGPEKLDEIVRKGIPTIELDLSTAYQRKRLGWTIEQLTDRLIHDPGIRHWLHLPERAAEKEWPTAIPETQTQTKPASPVTSTRIPRIYAPFEGTLLVFDPWYGLVPRDPVARAQLIQELDARRSTEK